MLQFSTDPFSNDFDPARALGQLRLKSEWASLRYFKEISQSRSIRNGRPERNLWNLDQGVQVEVLIQGHLGYASTSDLSPEGLQRAYDLALQTTLTCAPWRALHFSQDLRPTAKGQYLSHQNTPVAQGTLEQITEHLLVASSTMKISDEIVQCLAEVIYSDVTQHLVSTSGTDIHQRYHYWTTNYQATAQRGSLTQRRSLNGMVARCKQGGLESLDLENILPSCERTGHQALELLDAEECPADRRDLILMPDQMLLQIHESIGHPLELDRILGDERNYAGWSFVKPSDFGKLQYGSGLMNVTFDPTVPREFANSAFDDCGNRTEPQFLIQNGVLMRGLGSLESQKRSGLLGVANFRSASWNRAPIDRMANLNLEPGQQSLAEMIAQTQKGVLMESNTSWSIDDYRNKFQFGCEYGRLIENGKLTKTVRNPNYRGVTVPFWRSLMGVGTLAEREIFGSPYCGKGEPSQVIRVGHASPPCLFSQIEVFGGGH